MFQMWSSSVELWLSSSLGFFKCPPWLGRGMCPGMWIKNPRNAFWLVHFSLVQPTRFLSGNLSWLALNHLSVCSISYLRLQPCFWFPAVLPSQCNLKVFIVSITLSWELLNFPSPVPGGTTASPLLNWVNCSLKKDLCSYCSRCPWWFFP